MLFALNIGLGILSVGGATKTVDFKLKLPSSQNIVWIPQEIVNALGRKLTLTPNSMTAVLYPDGADPGDVAKSLLIIAQDFELRAKRKLKN